MRRLLEKIATGISLLKRGNYADLTMQRVEDEDEEAYSQPTGK